MAANSLPQPLTALLTLGEDMADGLHTHEVAVGVKQNLETVLRAALAAAAIGLARAFATQSLVTFEINPLIVLPRGSGVVAVDALVVPAVRRSNPGPALDAADRMQR